MSTAILLNRDDTSQAPGYNISIRDMLFGSDLNDLGCTISDMLKRETNIEEIVLNLSEADIYCFKPKRFWGISRYVNDRVKEINSEATVKIILREDQLYTLDQVAAAELRIEVVYPTERAVPGDNNVCNASTPCTSMPSRDASHAAPTDYDPLIHASHYSAAYYIAILIGLICILAFAASFIFYQNTLVGFALAFGSGLLFFEAAYIIRTFWRSPCKKS